MWFYIGEKKLSQHQPFMDYVRMLGNELHWVDSNTGSGKTYMMGVRANELNKVLILSPFVALSDNIHTELLEHVDRDDIKVVSGTNHDWNVKVVVATYDKAVNAPIDLIKSFDCIFIDELQTIYEDEYRKCMSQMMALLSEVKKDLPVIALSATLIEDMLPLFNKISVSRNVEYQPNAKLIPDRKERIDARVIQGCQEAAERNEVYCLLLNNKDTLNDYRQLLEKNGIACTSVTSDTKNHEATKELMETQYCQTPVLLMTKAGQASLSINNLNLYKLGMVLDEGMSPESMMQYGSRFRKVLTPTMDIFIAVNTDSKEAMKKFHQRVASNPVFMVADQIEDETASVYKLKKAISENDDDIVQPILDGLIAKNRIHKDTTLEEIKDGSALSRVRVAQTIEQRRRLFYHWHLGALIRDTHFGIDVSDALEHVDTTNVVELKEAKSQRTKAKRDAKERYFNELVSIGYSKPELFDQPWLTTAHARAYEEAEVVYEAMKVDGANRNLMTLLWFNFKVKNIKKYNSFGKLFVKYQGEYLKLVDTANDAGLVGMTFSAKEYQEVIQGWLNAVSNGFVSFLATEKKAKRQLFEAVFKVKRSSDNTRVKILAVKSKSRTEKTLNPVKKSGKHGFNRLIA